MRHSSNPSRLNDVIAVLSAVTFSVAAVIVLRESPWPWDPVFYVETASTYGAPSEIPLEHRALRWGLLLPLSIVQSLFGNTEAGYYTLPILAVALLAVSVYLLSRRVFEPGWAAVAAVIATTNPVVISRSSHPFPDVAAAALITLGFAAFLWLDRVGPIPKLLLAIGAGWCLGYAYAVRDSVVVLAPIVIACLFISRVPLRYVTAALLGALSFLGIEFLIMNHWFGDPFARIAVIANRNTRTGPITDLAAVTTTEAFQGTLGLSLTAWFRRWDMIKGLGVAPLLGLAGSVFLSFGSNSDSKKFWRTMAAWIFIGWLIFVLMGIWRNNRGGFVFNLLQVRYWYVLVPPVTLGVVGALEWASKRTFRFRFMNESVPLRRITLAAAAGLCFVLVVGSVGVGAQVITGYSGMHELRNWLDQSGDALNTLAASPEAGSVAGIFTSGAFGGEGWSGEITDRNANTTSDLYLISWEDTYEDNVLFDGSWVDLSRPPDSWSVEFVAQSGRLALLRPNASAEVQEELPSSGPSLPTTLGASLDRDMSWIFPRATRTSPRYRVGFIGVPPRPICLLRSPDGEMRETPPAYSGFGLMPSEEETLFDVFCPSSDDETNGLRMNAGNSPGTVVTSILMLRPSTLGESSERVGSNTR